MTGDPRAQWFQDARFGLFLHWGLYSVPAGEWKGQRMNYIGEWIGSRFRIPIAEYGRLAERFDPQDFDADAWVRLARRAGMRYLVYTAKHHEGFAMYGSRCDPYNIVDATPFGRDPLKELAAACRRHGMTLGLYYSQDLDWHEPHGGDPGPAYPKNFGMSWGNDWDFPDYAAKNYAVYFEKKVKPQVRELLTGYGPIGLIWFDCPVSISRAQSVELWDLVRELQPGCLVNTRIGHGLGDYGSLGDNQAPSGPVEGVWETPATLNDTWGYKSFDHNWKSAAETLGALAGLAGQGVNYLLNIGPQPDGRLPQLSIDILNEIGDWMEVYGEAIHGTRRSPFPCGFDWGWITRRADPPRLYLLLKDWPARPLALSGLRNRVVAARELAAPGAELPFRQAVDGDVDELTVSLPAERPSPLPVIALDLAGAPEADQRLIAQDGVITLPAARARIHAGSGAGPALAPTGILAGWLDARDWLAWEVHIPAAGEHEVEVITSAAGHSRPWQGGHRVRFEAGGASLEAELGLDEAVARPDTRCYAQAVSRCGRLRFARAGTQVVALKPLAIQSNDGAGLALVAVRLKLARDEPGIES